MIRPKLYVMFSEVIQDELQRTGDLRAYLKEADFRSLRNGEDIVKAALHGFWGDAYELLRLYQEAKPSIHTGI